jgi:hypothetical protein
MDDGFAVDVLGLVPELRADLLRRDFGTESVVWSPLAGAPTALDPVATVMLDVIDGVASIGDFAVDVHEVVGIPLPDAQRQVARIVELFSYAGLLTWSEPTSTAGHVVEGRDLFVGPSTPCAENASRLGTVSLILRFGAKSVRVACDSRRGARRLSAALADHLAESDEDAPLGFTFSAPQGLQRHHRLEDRAGFLLSEARGLDSGLHALASHLTALLPPRPGAVRIQARGVVAGGRTIMCLSPLVYVPPLAEDDLARAGLRLIDRLALDIDVNSGRVANPDIPWPTLAALRTDPMHVGPGGTRRVDSVVVLAGAGSAPPSQAIAVARIAEHALHGSADDVLDAAARVTERARLFSSSPESLIGLLAESK